MIGPHLIPFLLYVVCLLGCNADDGPKVLIEPVGRNSLRVRVTLKGHEVIHNLPSAIMDENTRVPKIPSKNSSTVINGNIMATVSSQASGGLITISRVSDGKVLVRENARTFQQCQGPKSGPGYVCTNRTSISFSSNPEQHLYGTGQHMNQPVSKRRYSVFPDRLPRAELDTFLPPLNMKTGKWDFESCTNYYDSSGAEICLPWIVAATPPTLTKPCPSQSNQDLVKGVPISDRNGTFATEQGCAAQCMALPLCKWWLHQPSTNRCWLLEGAEGMQNATDRTLGLINECTATLNPGNYEYGLLWNMPNFGSMELGPDETTFTAYDPINAQVDWFVTTYGVKDEGPERPAAILRQYVDAVGHAPKMPEWGAGYWHSPMGRKDYSQKDVTAAVAGFYERDLPMPSLFVIDYFNWVNIGDYDFNLELFPKPKGMVDYLKEHGIRLMVSAWPFVGRISRSASEFHSEGVYVRDPKGLPLLWNDSVCMQDCYLYDPTSERGREFLNKQLMTGYGKYGIRNFWLDAAEPENMGQPPVALYSIGTSQQVGMMYPWYHSKAVHDGMKKANTGEVPVNLARSAWVGSWRWGAAVWNGDLQATWNSLKKSISAGLNAQMSGMAWWSHDIGGFSNCHIEDPKYRELLIRWFQFGVTSPVFRQHGGRYVEPWLLIPLEGYPTGKETYNAIVKMIKLRYELKPYVLELLAEVSEFGEPINRPLSYDFPDDAAAWYITDQYMFGPKYMVAPISDPNVPERFVYFPKGAHCEGGWSHYFSGSVHTPGSTTMIPTPLDELALFECLA